eukprot:13135004-Alexandrium_andersonii.AAC.1
MFKNTLSKHILDLNAWNWNPKASCSCGPVGSCGRSASPPSTGRATADWAGPSAGCRSWS